MKKSKYESIVNQRDGKLVLVDFYADWCGPCQSMMPTVQKIAKEHGSKLSVVKINIDKNPSLATNLNVRSVPMFILYREGKIIWKHLGGMTYNQLNSELKVFINR